MKIVKFISFSFLVISFFLSFTLPQKVQAGTWWDRQYGLGEGHSIGETYMETGEPNSIIQILSYLINIFLGFIGFIFLILIIIGGFTWMTAGGNQDNINKAKSQIKAGIIGLTIIVAAFSIAWFVTNNLFLVTH